MGSQRVLQAIAVVASAVASQPARAVAAPPPHERIAVIDLGSANDAALGSAARRSAAKGFADIPRKLQAAILAAGLEPVIGDGVEDALAGRDVDRDTVELEAALASAQRCRRRSSRARGPTCCCARTARTGSTPR
jgi:hypothetical protein